MNIDKIKDLLVKRLDELKEKYKIKEIGIFGSYIKGNQKLESDLDILVEFKKNSKLSLIDLIGIEIELSDLLGVKVDLVEKKSLKPYIGRKILQKVVYL